MKKLQISESEQDYLAKVITEAVKGELAVSSDFIVAVKGGKIVKASAALPSFSRILIPYSASVPFKNVYSYANAFKASANITLTVDETDAVPGAKTVYRIVGDGTSTLTLTGIKKTSTSGNFVTTNNFLNVVELSYDGISYWANIYQEASASAGDYINPVLQTVVVADANKNKIVLTYDETLSSTTFVPSEFKATGYTVLSGVFSGATLTITVDGNYVYGDVIKLSYTGTSVKDAAGNKAPKFTNTTITNNIVAP